ncbi:hypothetical protein OQA88_2696 [Cercophora sp. LCS_1]
MTSAHYRLTPERVGVAFRRATDAPRNPAARRVINNVRSRFSRDAPADTRRSGGRPSYEWTPARRRKLLRLWLCTTQDLNMLQICGLLEEEEFKPKETTVRDELKSLLKVLEDQPKALRPDNRAAMRTRLHILRQARTKAMGQRRAAATTISPARLSTRSISATWRQSTMGFDAVWDTTRPGGTENPQLVPGAESVSRWSSFSFPFQTGSPLRVSPADIPTSIPPHDRPARASFLSHHSPATRRLVLQVPRSSRTLSWFGDVASLLSGLTRASSTASHGSSATRTSTWTRRVSSISNTTAKAPDDELTDLGPRLSEDSLPARSTLESEKKPDTATQVATFLFNKAVVAKCCSGHVARCCAAGNPGRLCAHQRLRQVIGSVLPCQEKKSRVRPPFVVTKREVNERDALGNTLLHVAAAWGAPISVLMDILKHSDNVSTTNNNSETFLHVFEPCPATTTVAAFNDLVSYLYKRGFEFGCEDAEQRTCLSRLVARPSFPLRALNAFVELPGGIGRFFLQHKSRRGERLRHVICRRLNDQKLAVPQDNGDDDEASLAHQICEGSFALDGGPKSRTLSPSPPPCSPSPQDAEPDDGFLDFFIHYDFDVNHQASRTGRTPLMMLLARLQPGKQLQGKAELALCRLLCMGAGFDLRDHRGETALHYAVRLGLPSVVERLCAHNADVDAANHRALTPFHLAQLGMRDLRDLLSSPRMSIRFMQCATILAEYGAAQTPPPPMP